MTDEIGHLGLALSGGGSRAAAFHRGTLQAVRELGLIDLVDRVSTVSGGSVFGAAWAAARAKSVSDEVFLREMRGVLQRGFIIPALASPRLALLPLRSYSRTHRLAETFDDLLLRGLTLAELPEKPLLVMNAAILNNAQVARFSRNGLSGIGIGATGEDGPLPQFPLHHSIKLGFPTAASAAFPFALPPLVLERAKMSNPALVGSLNGHDSLILTDGGVLENLGVQTLLRSSKFAATHLIVSDAGTTERSWKPGGMWERLKNYLVYGVSADTLSRLLVVMNEKENRSMRQLVIQELLGTTGTGRKVLMIRVAQDWDRMLAGISATHLESLARRVGVTDPIPRRQMGKDVASMASAVRSFLEKCHVDLSEARRIYDEMDGKVGAAHADSVSTNFTSLSSETLDVLAAHARWQLHAVSAIFGAIPPRMASSLPPRLEATDEYRPELN